MVVGDYKEGYYIGVEVPEDDPEADKPFYGPNVWPADGIFFFFFFYPRKDFSSMEKIKFDLAISFGGWCLRYFAWMEADYGEVSSTSTVSSCKHI
jgi:hypothetical protein